MSTRYFQYVKKENLIHSLKRKKPNTIYSLKVNSCLVNNIQCNMEMKMI